MRDPASPSRAAPRAETGEDSRRAFTPGAIAAIRSAIDEVGGAEVFFFGRAGESGLIAEVEVAGRGNEGAAPAVLSRGRGMDVAIHNHPSGVLLPSDADLEVAAAAGDMGLGFAIVSNDVLRVRFVVPLLRRHEALPLEPADVEAVLGPGGALARQIRGYEDRPGQLQMAHSVARSFVEEKVAVLEAGTGTGKTFAYLVPAVLWAKRHESRVVVSTGTIPLQEQIVTKDVPALRSVLPPFTATLVKGRSNYVSLRRAAEATKADGAFFESEEERLEVERLAAWARETKTGDRGDLTPPPSSDAWERIESQSDNCLRAQCPTYARCHYFESRRAAARADVLVVNHALLVADLAVKREMQSFVTAAVLPPYDRVIVDEAHHLEEVAAEHLGVRATQRGVGRLLGRLRHKRDAGRGLLPALARALARVRDPLATRALRAIEEAVLPLRESAAIEVERAFGALALRARAVAGDDAGRELKLRLKNDARSREVVDELTHLREALELLASELDRATAGLEDLEALAEGALLEVRAAAGRVRSAAAALGVARDVGNPKLVRWVQVTRDRRGEDRTEIHAAPLDVAPVLREAFLERVKTAVFSSATLTVRGSFDYVERGLGVAGLGDERRERASVPSPFDYSRQALLGVPLDLPDPGAPSFDEATAAFVLEAVKITEGRAFVLFTSFRSLDRVHGRLAPTLRSLGLVTLKQGDGGRRALLERFKATPGSVLFGTDSFWEGVDVPGDGLVLVVIAKLPFRVPSEPIEEARAEAIRERGGDPFSELMLPRAVLKLKQGFGRLIRTRQDRGAVCVLDRRIVTKGYGRSFVESLPGVPLVQGPGSLVLEHVARVTRR